MKDRNKLIIIICLSGIIILLLALLTLKIIEANPKSQEQSQIDFAYKHLMKEYKEDKKNSTITDGKYTFISMLKDGGELKVIGEFNTENGNLIHMCISDGKKKLDVENEKITKDYLKENANFKKSTKACNYDE